MRFTLPPTAHIVTNNQLPAAAPARKRSADQRIGERARALAKPATPKKKARTIRAAFEQPAKVKLARILSSPVCLFLPRQPVQVKQEGESSRTELDSATTTTHSFVLHCKENANTNGNREEVSPDAVPSTTVVNSPNEAHIDESRMTLREVETALEEARRDVKHLELQRAVLLERQRSRASVLPDAVPSAATAMENQSEFSRAEFHSTTTTHYVCSLAQTTRIERTTAKKRSRETLFHRWCQWTRSKTATVRSCWLALLQTNFLPTSSLFIYRQQQQP